MAVAQTVRVPGARRRMSGAKFRRYLTGYLFISPGILGFIIFTAYPMLFSAIVSFTKYNLLSSPIFIGLANYDRMIQDKLFYTALYNTAYYTFIGVPIQIFLALMLAMVLNQKLRGIHVFRTLFYLPTVTPAVASVILFMYMYNPDYGFFNYVVNWFNGPTINWLGDPSWVKPAFIIMSFWGIGGQMVIFLAGLQSVPLTLQEAASIDGAGVLRRFWHITIPMITPVIFFNLVLGIIGSFQVFTVAFIATAGGPVNATLFYVLWLYNHAFVFLRMGYASTLGWVLLFIVMFFTAINFIVGKRWVYYEGATG